MAFFHSKSCTPPGMQGLGVYITWKIFAHNMQAAPVYMHTCGHIWMHINITVYALHEQLHVPAHICTGPGTHRTAEAPKNGTQSRCCKSERVLCSFQDSRRPQSSTWHWTDLPLGWQQCCLPDTRCGQVITLYKSHAHLI